MSRTEGRLNKHKKVSLSLETTSFFLKMICSEAIQQLLRSYTKESIYVYVGCVEHESYNPKENCIINSDPKARLQRLRTSMKWPEREAALTWGLQLPSASTLSFSANIPH